MIAKEYHFFIGDEPNEQDYARLAELADHLYDRDGNFLDSPVFHALIDLNRHVCDAINAKRLFEDK